MQPYFLPYIGYFQLINAVDTFVVYDNIKYTKKGWINRNRILKDGKDVKFSIPLQAGSDFLNVNERFLAADFDPTQMLNQFQGAYAAAPYFSDTSRLLKEILFFEKKNLFDFVFHSIQKACEHLQISTEIKISTQIDIDHSLKSQSKVLALCEAMKASEYINPIGGTELYDKEIFAQHKVRLKFLQTRPIQYDQASKTFIPNLSIVDVLMFNPLSEVRSWIQNGYDIIQ